MPTWKKVLIWGILLWLLITAPALVVTIVQITMHLVQELGRSAQTIGHQVGGK